MLPKNNIAEYIESRSDLFTGVNDQIWAFTELAYEEKQSADLRSKVLEDGGFDV